MKDFTIVILGFFLMITIAGSIETYVKSKEKIELAKIAVMHQGKAK